MFGKLFVVFVLFVYNGHCLTEIRLEDRHFTYIRHEYSGTTMSVPKHFQDTLSSCHVIFPNGVMYEVYPRNTIPFQGVFPLESVQPFRSCGIGFRNVGVSFSGVYELLSTVLHSADNSLTLTRQRHHMVVIESDFTSDKLDN
ncbi:uncharacterized protein LOC124543686 [Vanessa cardui]|uniref:uncharacterized protein LOC124543686 n=1 Tax=Vanessa cardui TaxID=171605 RepID=UPI001F146C81|nr:uncharacterized protein LOC124543686 [Vanessa cardui]